MSSTVLVIGESGSGKSTSLRNLDPKETFIINVLDKPLPFKGGRRNYVSESTEDLAVNYCATDDTGKIINIIKAINDRRPDIKNIIIDDYQYTMANEFMRRATEKGYDKFTEIARGAWSIINELTFCRADIDAFVLSHSEIDQNGKVKCKTIGKMLEEKINLEGMFTIVLHSLIAENQYRFLTQNDGSHVAKSPMGMFDRFIDNDLAYVKEQMKVYFDEDIAL